MISSDSYKEVMELADKADIPMVTTLMGMGAVPSSEKKYFGMVGMHGSYAANKCVSEADVILALGTRFSDRVALKPEHFARKARILQVEIDKSEVNKNVTVADSIIGDCREVLRELIPKVDKAEHREWIKQITLWNIEHPTVVREANGKMNPQEIIEYLCSHTDKETIFVTDVGQHQMWAAQYVKQTGQIGRAHV